MRPTLHPTPHAERSFFVAFLPGCPHGRVAPGNFTARLCLPRSPLLLRQLMLRPTMDTLLHDDVETVIAWHRRGFSLWWAWRSRRRIGRPTVPADIRTLIRTMAQSNPRWGAPRIHGELLKLGIDVCQATVAKYMVRPRQPPSQNMAHLPAESHRPDRGGRFLRGPDCDLPSLVRPGAPRPRSATHPARGGHRASDGGVDGPTAS
jgi:hypothetical protein